MWLVDAFFRLHRRRQFGQSGYQPLAYQEMADFGERVLKLTPASLRLYYLVMEETDNGVLYDHYQKTAADAEKIRQEQENSGKNRPRRRAATRK